MIIENGCYKVYILTNTVNGKMYIGVTKKPLSHRFLNGEGYRHNKEFYADIQKIGWDKIDQQLFASNLTEEEAFNMERLLISELRKQDENLLYNKDGGGKYGKHCNETKQIIRDANVGRIISEETKAKIREARAKQVILHESIMKTAEKNRGRKMSPEFCKRLGERSSKKVLCFETNTVYDSATKAAKDLNVSLSGISQVCSNKIPHTKRLHFKYI